MKLGGTFLDSTKVTKVLENSGYDDNMIQVQAINTITKKELVLHCKGFVACPGPWAPEFNEIIPFPRRIPVKIFCLPVQYYKIKPGMTFPKVTFCDTFEGDYTWGIPEVEYPGLVKVRVHTFCWILVK